MSQINIKIQKIEENGEVYFLATCDQIHAFMAEWDTMEDLMKNSEDVLISIIENTPKKPAKINMNYNMSKDLQLA